MIGIGATLAVSGRKTKPALPAPEILNPDARRRTPVTGPLTSGLAARTAPVCSDPAIRSMSDQPDAPSRAVASQAMAS